MKKVILKKFSAAVLATIIAVSFTSVMGTLSNGNVGQVEAKATISIGSANVDLIDDQAYTGKAIKPPVVVEVDGETLAEGTDYFCEYFENINVGTATVLIEGKGNYSGHITRPFEIIKQSGSPDGRWDKKDGYWIWLDPYGDQVYNKWIKDKGKWYFIKTNGRMAVNEWIKDSKGWCYLGSDGKMVTNGWAKDSKGWCWMDAYGYCTKNKWIRDNGEWYFIKANGYMAANEWAKDSGGWMYMASNGKITKNQWIKYGGYWYYLKSNGYMATGKITINGKTYRFDFAGRWIS